jgi:hypothetical protein
MASYADIADKSIRLILLYLKNISLNCYRRFLILLKYFGIFWQNRRMAKQYRRFGASIYAYLAAGDVNPLLQEEVRDQLTSLQLLQENILTRQEALEQIREEIKATSYQLAPSPAAPGAEPKTDEPVA